MPRSALRNHMPAFKSRLAMAAIKGDRTVARLVQHFDLHPNQMTKWKTQLLDRAGLALEAGVHENAVSR